MDEFYKIVTGEPNAFYKMCMVLPSVIEDVVNSSNTITTPNDTVIDELKEIAESKNGSFALALYMLGFGSYIGFDS